MRTALGAALLGIASAVAQARGVTQYLPLNLDPQIERQIERVLILADRPVMARPIAVATVLDALPAACKVDAALCDRVQRYLSRYTGEAGITHASLEGALAHGADVVLPNRYGMDSHSAWAAAAAGYVQPSDYLLVAAGGVSYQGKTDFTGSMVSLGTGFAQLDIGYRPHWFSPLSDSSLLMSTEAATMPSVTLSNSEPLTRLGLRYEIFDARMSSSDHIAEQHGFASGNPLLAGIHVSMEPVSGWSFAVNRLLQYGGAGRPSSPRDFLNAFFNPSRYDNTNDPTQGFGNEEASVTSSFVFPGKTPFVVYAEYAGEDTSRGKNYLLGNSALSAGIRFPRLWERFDLTYEFSDWQNGWYVHSTYQDGLTNDGRVVGHWFGDQRVFNDDVVGQIHTVRLGWSTFGGEAELRYRTLQNQNYGAIRYERFHDVALDYAHPWRGFAVGGEIETGQDVFGSSFARIAGFIRYGDPGATRGAAAFEAPEPGQPGECQCDLFVDAGLNVYRLRTDLTDPSLRTRTDLQSSPHLALGARRAVTQHSDLGMRVELDDIEGHNLVGIRLIDYRYRFNGPLALTAFLGAARYALGTPAYGFYYGGGIQWRNLLPRWDLGVEFRSHDSVARDHLLPSDPQSPRPDSFYDILSGVLTVSHRF